MLSLGVWRMGLGRSGKIIALPLPLCSPDEGGGGGGGKGGA